jgi:hypothetical protein
MMMGGCAGVWGRLGGHGTGDRSARLRAGLLDQGRSAGGGRWLHTREMRQEAHRLSRRSGALSLRARTALLSSRGVKCSTFTRY